MDFSHSFLAVPVVEKTCFQRLDSDSDRVIHVDRLFSDLENVEKNSIDGKTDGETGVHACTD